MEAHELMALLGCWEEKEAEAERQMVLADNRAEFARRQQARVIGQLAEMGVLLFPPLEHEEELEGDRNKS